MGREGQPSRRGLPALGLGCRGRPGRGTGIRRRKIHFWLAPEATFFIRETQVGASRPHSPPPGGALPSPSSGYSKAKEFAEAGDCQVPVSEPRSEKSIFRLGCFPLPEKSAGKERALCRGWEEEAGSGDFLPQRPLTRSLP